MNTIKINRNYETTTNREIHLKINKQENRVREWGRELTEHENMF